MAKIVLIQPKIGNMDSFRTKPFLPLGLLHAASYAAREYDTVLIDQRIKGWYSKLEHHLTNQTICAAITVMTGPQINHALEISNIVKRKSRAKVIWGGVHPTLLPQQTLANENIDIVIQGEGEESLFKTIIAVEGKKSPQGIDGVWYKNENGVIEGNISIPKANLNQLPNLPYHLINLEDYIPLYQGKKSVTAQSSRGCVHACSYCYNSALYKGSWRAFPLQAVIRNLRFLAIKGVENVYFVDDNFFADISRALKIAAEIKKIGIGWQAQGLTIDSAKQITNTQWKFLESTNLKRITIGVESGSDRIRRLIGKTGSCNDIITLNKTLSKFKIIPLYSFIVGFPSETDNERKETIRLLLKLLNENKNVRTTPVYNLIPYPGTRLMKIANRYGFNAPKKLDEWAAYDFSSAHLPYIKDKEMYKSLYFSSIFLDDKFSEYDTRKIIKTLSNIYKPIARFRIKNNFFRFMLERKIAEKFIRL